MTVIELIRLFAPEFAGVDDATLEKWIETVAPMVSQKQFGKLYKQALAYMVCHKLKMAGYGDDVMDGVSSLGIGLAVSSVSEGGSSISFGVSQSGSLASDAELAMTIYGVQFLQLRRTVIVPIHISGGSY